MGNFRLKMTQKEIAIASGLSQQHISLILNGDRQPSVSTAESLEKSTGVCREAWIWPEDHFNPYIPFTDGIYCSVCRWRLRMIDFAFKQAEVYLLKHPTIEAFREVTTHYYDFIKGYNRNIAIVWGHFEENTGEYRRLAESAYEKMDFSLVPAEGVTERWPWLAEQLREGKDVFSIDIQKTLRAVGAVIDLESAERLNLTALTVLVVKKRVYVGGFFNNALYALPSSEIVECLKGFLGSKAMDKIIDNLKSP